MNDKVIGKGKTVEEAINNALLELGKTLDEVETNVLEFPDNGVFGLFGKKQAVVEVTPKDDPEKRAVDFLTDMMSAMKIPCSITTSLNNDVLSVELAGDNMGVLIGRRGQTLDSIQYLTSLVVNRKGSQYVRVVIDTENYRSKREQTLEALARKMAGKVVRYNKRMSLEPMNPSERRIIHAALQNHSDVYTFSEGDEPYRYVVIDLKDHQ
ncbi:MULTISPECIES: RNA-binding cell elongation regulator Jag/EloR [Eubacterium]|uniref:RNA-binding protein KhpB n=1 Tax=Eubacterium barkeri TaxID=1528 RepID=A0A1H3F6Q5_EUBBA|nr:RNA-binding cell elongation regulator Jag/EloR [Eubacterium barkeri]SDX85874.1 spoIIIJ-associated protein [Eubacterium barkeri]